MAENPQAELLRGLREQAEELKLEVASLPGLDAERIEDDNVVRIADDLMMTITGLDDDIDRLIAYIDEAMPFEDEEVENG